MAYKPLPIVDVPVDDLRLDLLNYRIPIAPDDEGAALNYLFASEDVLDQIKLFLRDGYFDNEVPIAVKEGRSYVVLEGNRRVSALKAIARPEVVPAHQGQVEDLRTRYATEVPNMPQSIRVIVVPSRAAAHKHVARLHTGIPKKRWSLDQQANYYFSLLGPGVSVADLKALYPDVDIIRFLRMVAVRQFLAGAKFKERALREYVKSADLKMSSFEYAYRNAAIASAVGMVFDSDGRLLPARKKPRNVGAALPEQERTGLEYLMDGFWQGRLNTRSPEFKSGSEAQVDLLARLLGVADEDEGDDEPGPTGGSADGGSGTGGPGTGGSGNGPGGGAGGSDAGGGAGGSGAAGTGGGGRGPNDPDTRKGLSVAGLPFDHVPSNLEKRLLELRKINVDNTPASAAMLLRSVLEATIKWHYSGAAQPATGMLNDVFAQVVKSYGGQRRFKDSINAIKTGPTTKPGSINWFNAAAHNPDIAITPADVRAAYAMVQPVLIRLLRPA